MTEQQTIGRITFGVNLDSNGQPIARTVRVVKTNDKPDIDHRRTEIAMLRSLIVRYPKQAAEFVITVQNKNSA